MFSQCPISCASETSQVLSPVLFLINPYISLFKFTDFIGMVVVMELGNCHFQIQLAEILCTYKCMNFRCTCAPGGERWKCAYVMWTHYLILVCMNHNLLLWLLHNIFIAVTQGHMHRYYNNILLKVYKVVTLRQRFT